MTMALPRDGSMLILSTPTESMSWLRDLVVPGRIYPFGGDVLMRPRRPMDSIRLRLPWGKERNFLVPAADPYNPVFETIARGAHPHCEHVVELQHEVSVRFLCGGGTDAG